jgi:hypothetical protein
MGLLSKFFPAGSIGLGKRPGFSLNSTKTAASERSMHVYHEFCHRRWFAPGTASTGPFKQQILEVSPILEPQLDGEVLEKPCTVVLMEPRDIQYGSNNDDDARPTSWLPAFQTKIPLTCGMSFASILFQSDSDGRMCTTSLDVTSCLNELKVSSLSRMHDTVLVARGPFASICAQYYLESLPLQGLIMVDPILLKDDGDDKCLKNILAHNSIDESDWDRFYLSSLLLERNAVPMMVILSTHHEEWNEASRRVAARHSDEKGLYGNVAVLNLTEIMSEKGAKDNEGVLLVDLVNDWIDENVL